MSETKFALSTRVVLITGATSGIGRACAELLASSGWRVFGTGRSLSSALPPAGHVEMVEMDVDDDASVHAGVATVIAKAGRLDAVINNAGFSMRGAVEDTAIVEAKAIFETNFFGVLRVCRAVMPALRANGGGYIVKHQFSGWRRRVAVQRPLQREQIRLGRRQRKPEAGDASVRHSCGFG